MIPFSEKANVYINDVIYLKHLQDVVELSLARSTRWCHGNARWNGRDTPAKFVHGCHSEFVAIGRTEIVDDKVFVFDVISQIHPINVRI